MSDKKLLIPIIAEDFSGTEFPEFFQGNNIERVLDELNAILSESTSDPKTSESIEILKRDMIDSPYLYISAPLIQKLGKS